jgi:hypothetical protein
MQSPSRLAPSSSSPTGWSSEAVVYASEASIASTISSSARPEVLGELGDRRLAAELVRSSSSVALRSAPDSSCMRRGTCTDHVASRK